jgi:hypothetical protein
MEYNTALKIYNYYYQQGLKEFDGNSEIANMLAKIPADYVYNSLINRPGCYINSNCCLEYCNDLLDSEYEKLDPMTKRAVYEKMKGVSANVSNFEIDNSIKQNRKKFKSLWNNQVNKIKSDRENQLNVSMNRLNISNNLNFLEERIFKNLNLN